MKYLMIIAVCAFTNAMAQDNIQSESGNGDQVLGYIDCKTSADHKSVSDFVESIKSGEEIDPKDLINNPNFLSPCFREKSGNYEASFVSLTELTRSILNYKNSEHDSIDKTNAINEKLGTARVSKGKVKAKKSTVPVKPYVAPYTKSFKRFKDKAKLIGTIENSSGFVAMIELAGVPFNDVHVGQSINGVEIVEIGFGYVKFRDKGALKRSSTINVGG